MIDFDFSKFLYPFSIYSYKRELERNSVLSREELNKIQDQKLRDLIVYSIEHVPFYQKYFSKNNLRPEDIKTQKDLRKLPIITKQMMRERPEDFISNVHKKYHSHTVGTSGSTGNSFQFYVGKDSKAAIFASIWNTWGINGYQQYDRWMNFKGYAFSNGDLMRYSRITNCIGIPCCSVTEDIASQIREKMISFRPKHLMGYSSFIYDFCKRHKGDTQLRNLGIQQVVTSSEMLYDYQREVIEETFGCKVFSMYHQVEQVCFIYECENQTKHLSHEYGILEVVDNEGNPVSDGQIGSMVCTGFFNRSMPFIRYQLDDLIKCSPSSVLCSCGRQHQVIESLEGRGSDVVISLSGNKYNHMDVAFHDLIGISGVQIVQNELATLDIKILKNQFWQDSMQRDLAYTFNQYTQSNFILKFEFVDELIKAKNGKQQLVISNLPKGYLI